MLIGHGEKAGWLAPIALEPPRKKVREKSMTRRASNKGCLSMILDEYLKLLDWTGPDSQRQSRSDPRGLCSDPRASGMQCRNVAGFRKELPQTLPLRPVIAPFI